MEADRLSEPYDVHIIGSGIGALTTALLLTKVFHKRVCLLEQHWQAGGQTQVFSRKGRYEWDVGLHYVGNMNHANALPAQLGRYISNNRLQWRKLDKEYDKIRFEDAALDVGVGRQALEAELIKQFPDEASAIRRYFTHRKQASSWLSQAMIAQTLPAAARPLLKLVNLPKRGLGQVTLKQYLDKHFKSTALKNLLGARYGDYGLAPEQSSFAIHALVMDSYRGGAYFPEGGSREIARICLDELRACGGECLTNVKVERIVTEGQRVTALEVIEQYHTPEAKARTIAVNKVISSAGAYNTYRKLLDRPLYPELEQLPQSGSAITLYLGLDKDPTELGFGSSNYWLYPKSAHDGLLSSDDAYLFLSFPSVKRGSVGPSHQHCAEVICHASAETFAAWAGSRWKKRGKDYRQLKQTLIEKLLDDVCAFYPQLRDAVCYTELSTPLSIEFFTQHPGGNMYGVPFVPGRERFAFCRAQTPLDNLFLSGQDVFSLGVMGALAGGMLGAAVSEGSAGMPAVIKAVKGYERAREQLPSMA